MTPGQVVLLVLGILAFNVALWIPIVLWLRSRTRAIIAALTHDFDVSGERTLVAPESALCGGATGPHPRARGNAVVALTDRRLVVRRLAGDAFEIARADITAVREAKSFLGRSRGTPFVVVTSRDGSEVGLLVREHRAWLAALGRS